MTWLASSSVPHRPRRSLLPFLLLVLSLAIAHCGGGKDAVAPPPTPASITTVQGDAQTGPAGEPLPVVPTVLLLDRQGKPLSGTAVHPFFIGANAGNAFLAVGGDSYTGTIVPVENTGGTGTRDGHWRESVFGNELMTGYLSAGANPLSVVTIESLADQGYGVNTGAADLYSLTGPLPARGPGQGIGLDLKGDIFPGPVVEVSPDGQVRPVPPR